MEVPSANDAVADAGQAFKAATELQSERKATVMFTAGSEDAPLKDAEKEAPGAGSGDAHALWGAVQVALSDFLETVEAQVGLVLLIGVDVCVSMAQLYLKTRDELAEARRSRHYSPEDLPVTSPFAELVVAIAARAMSAFSAFAMGIFVLELVVLFVVFKRKFVAHAGFAFDAALLTVTIMIESWTDAKGIRLLGVLRIWRVFRVVNVVVERERDAHDAARAELEVEKASAIHLRMEKFAVEESLKREYTSREGLERLLYDYKDEVATLKEALEIAAQAVAEAEMLRGQQSVELAIKQETDIAAAEDYEQQYYSSSADAEYYPTEADAQGTTQTYSYDAYYEYHQADDELQEEKQAVMSDDAESDFEDAIESSPNAPSDQSR